jgi:2-keto-3-deoxy-L-rhamnonate aldolase RhmA
MRSNPVKQTLAAGGTSCGTMAFEFFTPGLPQIVRAAGADFVLFDMEHSGLGFETLKTQVGLCRGIGLTPLVRVPATQYHFIARALDVGAMGVMVPMVETREQAQLIVSCTRYPPRGIRGAAFGVVPHDDYSDLPVVDKMRLADERTLVICLVETVTGHDNVDAIAAVPGVDVCWLGHFDTTSFMGIPAQWEHPRYTEAVRALVAACDRHGKAAGFLATDDDWARRYRDLGFRMLAYGVDTLLLQQALARGLAGLRRG